MLNWLLNKLVWILGLLKQSINPDDPGIFGLESTAMDFLLIAVFWEYSIDVIHVCLVNSITHSAFPKSFKSKIKDDFNEKWLNFETV